MENTGPRRSLFDLFIQVTYDGLYAASPPLKLYVENIYFRALEGLEKYVVFCEKTNNYVIKNGVSIEKIRAELSLLEYIFYILVHIAVDYVSTRSDPNYAQRLFVELSKATEALADALPNNYVQLNRVNELDKIIRNHRLQQLLNEFNDGVKLNILTDGGVTSMIGYVCAAVPWYCRKLCRRWTSRSRIELAILAGLREAVKLRSSNIRQSYFKAFAVLKQMKLCHGLSSTTYCAALICVQIITREPIDIQNADGIEILSFETICSIVSSLHCFKLITCRYLHYINEDFKTPDGEITKKFKSYCNKILNNIRMCELAFFPLDYQEISENTTHMPVLDDLQTPPKQGVITRLQKKIRSFKELDEYASFNAECAICIDPLDLATYAIMDSCRHNFCKPCIIEWFKNQRTCPVCRAVIYAYTSRELVSSAKLKIIGRLCSCGSVLPSVPEAVVDFYFPNFSCQMF